MRLPRIGIRVGDRLLSKLKFANVQSLGVSKSLQDEAFKDINYHIYPAVYERIKF